MNPPISLPKFDPVLLHPMRQLWEQALDLSAAQIAERFNVSKNTVIGHADRNGWKRRGPRRVLERKPRYPGQPIAIGPERTAAAAAVMTSVRLALADREPRTLHDRMDAAHAKLNAVLEETRRHVEGRQRLVMDARRAAA